MYSPHAKSDGYKKPSAEAEGFFVTKKEGMSYFISAILRVKLIWSDDNR
jgi:hypothetical protein